MCKVAQNLPQLSKVVKSDVRQCWPGLKRAESHRVHRLLICNAEGTVAPAAASETRVKLPTFGLRLKPGSRHEPGPEFPGQVCIVTHFVIKWKKVD
jgi:hypothetical protein